MEAEGWSRGGSPLTVWIIFVICSLQGPGSSAFLGLARKNVISEQPQEAKYEQRSIKGAFSAQEITQGSESRDEEVARSTERTFSMGH